MGGGALYAPGGSFALYAKYLQATQPETFCYEKKNQ